MLSVRITDFGAAANGAPMTRAIQNAIDHVFAQGGGEVVVPEGSFTTGGIRLRSNVALRLLHGAYLVGSRDPEDYFAWRGDEIEPANPADIVEGGWRAREMGKKRDFSFLNKPFSRWNNALIRAVDAVNVSIIGEGDATFDGADCYDAQGEEDYRGPHGIDLFRCENVTLRGYKFQNASNWAHALFFCRNVSYDHVTCVAGHDGIHITGCVNVDIADSAFYTGDDCVAGFGNVNVTVQRCEINTACSGMRFGGTNAYIRDCHFFGPAKHLFRGSLSVSEKRDGVVPTMAHRYNMLSVFTYYADFSVDIPDRPGNIVIADCRIENTDRLLHYNFSGNELWQANRPLSSVRFENVRAEGICMPLTAYGDEAEPLRLEIVNMAFAPRAGFEQMTFMHLCNCGDLYIEGLTLPEGYKAIIKRWPGARGRVRIPDTCELTDTTEPFVCQAI